MGKIFCLMGKSSTGKDTIYKMLRDEKALQLQTIVPYTTRPIRTGETEGVEYHFIDEQRLLNLEKEGKVIEQRAYDTIYGIWRYATIADGQVNLSEHSYLLIGTLAVYTQLCAYYGKDAIVPIYIEVEDGLRLQRALDRERMQDKPKYTELCRRFLADDADFAEEALEKAGITRHFENDNLQKTVEEIAAFVLSYNG